MIGVAKAAVVAVAMWTSPAPTIADDYAAAQKYWGWDHPALCKTLEVSENEKTFLGAIGTATFPSGFNSECWIRIKPLKALEEGLAEKVKGHVYEARCWIMVHEYGHTLNIQHSSTPGDVMYPSLAGSFDHPIDVCKSRRKFDEWQMKKPRYPVANEVLPLKVR